MRVIPLSCSNGLGRRALLTALPFLAVPPLVAVMAGGSAAFAFEAATTGVVLLHGKWQEGKGLQPVAEPLRNAGFLVETPNMPWAGSRLYDRSVVEAYDEIDAAVARLRTSGARRIILGGHSSGGAAAFRYAALGRDVAALVLIAPAPIIESEKFQSRVAGELARAKALAAEGKGDDPAEFKDFNSIGHSIAVTTTANRYLSFNAPDGPAALTRAAPKLRALPILWLAPTEDPGTEAFEHFIVPLLPSSVRLDRIAISGGHMEAPQAAGDRAARWLLAIS